MTRRFNPLRDRKLSLGRLIAFAGHQLAAMIAENPNGLLDECIAETAEALNAVGAVRGDQGHKLGLQKARTKVKRAFRKALPAAVAQFYGVVLGQFGAGALELPHCFPRGRSIFDRCRDAQLDKELAALVEGLDRLAGALPPAQVSAAQGLRATWNSLLGTQIAAMTTQQAGLASIAAAEAMLERALYRNTLWLAFHFGEDEAKARFYCPEHLLRARAGADPENWSELACARPARRIFTGPASSTT